MQSFSANVPIKNFWRTIKLEMFQINSFKMAKNIFLASGKTIEPRNIESFLTKILNNKILGLDFYTMQCII